MVRRSSAFALVVAILIASIAAAADGDGRRAADQLGRFLTNENPDELAAVLPERGKIRLALPSFGAEPGSYAPAQVETLLRSGLARLDVTEFRIERDWHDGPYALVRASAKIRAEERASQEVRFDLAFQREDDRWVLREFRESAP